MKRFNLITLSLLGLLSAATSHAAEPKGQVLVDANHRWAFLFTALRFALVTPCRPWSAPGPAGGAVSGHTLYIGYEAGGNGLATVTGRDAVSARASSPPPRAVP